MQRPQEMDALDAVRRQVLASESAVAVARERLTVEREILRSLSELTVLLRSVVVDGPRGARTSPSLAEDRDALERLLMSLPSPLRSAVVDALASPSSASPSEPLSPSENSAPAVTETRRESPVDESELRPREILARVVKKVGVQPRPRRSQSSPQPPRNSFQNSPRLSVKL